MRDAPGKTHDSKLTALAALFIASCMVLFAWLAVNSTKAKAHCDLVQAAGGYDICLAFPTEYNFFKHVCHCGNLQTIHEPVRSPNARR